MTATPDVLRIAHMASLARSGETMLLRAWQAHPQVHVVHDLRATNTDAEHRLYRLLRSWPLATLPRAALADAGIDDVPAGATVLLLKQGVFTPRWPVAGFGLVRNPYAVFCSLWRYDAKLQGQDADAATHLHHWHTLRLPRLLVWADATAPGLQTAIRAETDPVRQFLRFWQARVAQIVATQRCVLTYEDFVTDPAPALQRVCRALALPFDAAMLQAHRRWTPGTHGHGGMDLAAPIRPAPAWAPDPQVPLAPFRAAVDGAPVPAWRGLYDRPPIAMPSALAETDSQRLAA
jgi:hypothetical protein